MRKLIFLVLGFSLAQSLNSTAQAQVVRPQIADSSGTANTHWQTLDFFDTAAKNIEVINYGSVNLSFASKSADTTGATDTARRRTIVKPGELLPVGPTNAQYFYIKAASGTCAYTVRIANGSRTIGSPASQLSAIDSLVAALYAATPGGIRDSIVITRSTPNTAYTIGDMYGTSLTAASNTFFKLTNSTLLAGRIGYVEKVIGAADSGYTNVIIRVHFMSDTTGHTAFADNAAFAIDGTYSSIIGYADLSFDGQGTVSTVYSKAVNSTLHLSYTASPLYAFVTMLTGSTLKNGGKFTIYVEYLKP